jgi:plastocyanin
MRLLLIFLLALMTPAMAAAADLVVSVRNAAGRPVADAVVMVISSRAGPVRIAGPYRMAQRNLQFEPFVLVAPVGAEVVFPNLDNVRHHVYSFSPAKKFELKLYGREEARVVRFDKAGVVALGCNIHDGMVAFIMVVDTPLAAKTDAAGQAVIHGVPAGAVTVKVWHPYLRAPGNTLSSPANAPAEGAVRLNFTGELRAPPDHHQMY